MVFHVLIVDLNACTNMVLYRNSSPMTMTSRLCPTNSSVMVSVPKFILASVIHLELSFVQDDKYGSAWISKNAST